MKNSNHKGPSAVEQVLEREIQTLVDQAIGQPSTDVSCMFISKSDLAVLIENVDTPLESFLGKYCRPETLQAYRGGLEHALGKRVRRIIENTINCPIHQVSMSRQTETRWMGIFALLES